MLAKRSSEGVTAEEVARRNFCDVAVSEFLAAAAQNRARRAVTPRGDMSNSFFLLRGGHAFDPCHETI